jgi:hypothetical protein
LRRPLRPNHGKQFELGDLQRRGGIELEHQHRHDEHRCQLERDERRGGSTGVGSTATGSGGAGRRQRGQERRAAEMDAAGADDGARDASRTDGPMASDARFDVGVGAESGSGSCLPGAVICDDFEKYADGATNLGPDWVTYTYSGTVRVDTTKPRGGAKPHVTTQQGCGATRTSCARRGTSSSFRASTTVD